MEINYDTQHAAGRNSYHEFVKMNVWINFSMSTAKEICAIKYPLIFLIFLTVEASLIHVGLSGLSFT